MGLIVIRRYGKKSFGKAVIWPEFTPLRGGRHLAEFTPLCGAVFCAEFSPLSGARKEEQSALFRPPAGGQMTYRPQGGTNDAKQMTFFRCEAANDVLTNGRHK